jgi:hypothetical protein
MIHLVAEDSAIALNDEQAQHIQSCLLERVPARRCTVRQEPPVEIIVTGNYAADLHPPLLERVEAIAGCRFRVTTTDP